MLCCNFLEIVLFNVLIFVCIYVLFENLFDLLRKEHLSGQGYLLYKVYLIVFLYYFNNVIRIINVSYIGD